MNEHHLTPDDSGHGTVRSYTIGFILSIGLTIGSYIIVTQHLFTTRNVIAAILGLAVLQLLIQVLFFLHLGRESKPRWNLVAFLFMLLVVLIVVIGSIWIMANLDYNMMSPQQTTQYIEHEENIKL